MKEELISILIPCYNHEKFVADCLESILAQSYANIELIICDDCSTDDSWKVIEHYRQKLEKRLVRVTILQNEKNLGVTKTLNKMISLANGKYIKSIASDDFFDENYCTKVIQYFKDNYNTDVLVCNGRKVDEQSSWSDIHVIKKIYPDGFEIGQKDIFESLYSQNFICAPSTIMRREVFENNGLYDENCYTEDWEYWLRITKENSVHFGYLEEPLIYYRINENSITSCGGEQGKLDVRRTKLHDAEMTIIEKYGKNVAVNQYADRKMDCIITEYMNALQLGLKKTESITEKEYNEFNMWNKISVRKRLKYKFWLWKSKQL